MIDIEEAARSLDFYAQLLDLQCDHYNVTAAPGLYLDADSPVTNLKDQTMSRLRTSHKESLVLSIVLFEEMAREAKLQSVPITKFSKVMEASNRMVVASRKAGAIIQENDRKELEKNTPRPKSALSEILEKLRRER